MKPICRLATTVVLCNVPLMVVADSRGCYQAQPPLRQAMAILEAGLCKTAAEVFGSPVCNDVRAFRTGTAPMLPVGSFTIGVTFRVEQSANGSVAWSEDNPLYALYNVGESTSLSSVRLLDVESDSPAEAREAERYVASVAAGHRDKTSSLHQYVESARENAPQLSLISSPDGRVGTLPCMTVYIRQIKDKIYAVLSTEHETSFEIDAHPVIYFVVFPSTEVR